MYLPCQAKNTIKMMKNTMRTRNTFIMSHLLDVTDWKYLRISP